MHTIYHNFIIQANPEQVFAAISEPQDLENWWPLKCNGKAAVGEVYNFNFTENYMEFGQESGHLLIMHEPGS